MPLGPFDPIPKKTNGRLTKIRISHINDMREALTGVQDAYDVAVADGFVGTRGEWLQSLKGDPGAGMAPIGSAATFAALPSSGNTVGDVRTVDADGRAYRWSGSAWVDVGLFRGPGGIDTELRARVDPGTAGAAGQFAVWDSDLGRVGWFNGPVLVSSWAPYKAEANDTPMSARLQTFLSALTSTKMAGVLLPGTYRGETPLNVGSDTTLFAHGVKLDNYTTGTIERLLQIHNRDRVRIIGMEIDGRKGSYATATEQRHNIDIRGSRWVTLEDVYTHDAKGDGVLIGRLTSGSADGINPDGPVNEHITLHRVNSTGNHRQGMSISKARHVHAYDSAFTYTAGTLPECGVDVEPDQDYYPVEDIQLVRCELAYNNGSGFVSMLRDAPTQPQRGLTLDACQVHDNAVYGVSFNDVLRGLVRDSDIYDNALVGLELTGKTSYSAVEGGVIRENGTYGVLIASSSGDTQTGNRLEGVDILDNGQSSVGNYEGVTIQGVTANDLVIRRIRSRGTSQRRGIESRSQGGTTFVNRMTFEHSDVTGNASGGARFLGTHTEDSIRNVRGHATEAKGSATILDAASTVSVTHGLVAAPSVVVLTPRASGSVWVSARSTTTFTISRTGTSGALAVDWRAEV